jgi:hypothetical protein
MTQQYFGSLAAGATEIFADSTGSKVTIAAGTNIAVSANSATATLTISVTGGLSADLPITQDNDTNATNYVVFNAATSGSLAPKVDSGLYYNPATGILAVTGIRFGDATIASTASEAFAVANFSFNIAGDDSTQRTISRDETVKFIGAGGITTASDAEGNITITGSGGLPSQTGNTGKYLTTDGSALSWATVAGGGGISTANIQQFTSVGTSAWTKPVGAKLVYIVCQGSGGGGGSGFKQLASPTDLAISGGNGGGAGGWTELLIPAVLLGDTETVTVGVGGTGGVSQTIAGGGNPGGNGNSSSFGAWCVARGGVNGPGGSTGSSGGGSGVANTANFVSILIGTTALSGTGTTPIRGQAGSSAVKGGKNGGGGAAGGGILAASPTALAGGNGGEGGAGVKSTSGTTGGGGTAGISGSPTGGNGSNSTNYYIGGDGGGGGASQISANGGNGGNGGNSAGGGGGGACQNTFNSGAGGNGGNGSVMVITFF